MEPDRNEFEVVAELESMRPRPRPAFATELDARVASGFAESGGDPWQDRLRTALDGLSWRRLGVPLGATALAAIVVATAVIAVSESGSGGEPGDLAQQEQRARPGAGSGGGVEYDSSPPVAGSGSDSAKVHEFSTNLP